MDYLGDIMWLLVYKEKVGRGFKENLEMVMVINWFDIYRFWRLFYVWKNSDLGVFDNVSGIML